MKKILFASDLDNTLIHSKKHVQEGDLCIEHLNGQPQSYISALTVENLCRIVECAEFIPVTTRSVEQYLRIKWPDGCKPKYALTTNGTILLEDEVPVQTWRDESAAVAERYACQMEELKERILENEIFLKSRVVDGMFLFAYADEGVKAGEHVEEYQGLTELQSFSLGRKAYFFPPEFYKGAGVERLKAQMGFQKVIAAGDSDMDITLLDAADIGFAPKGLEGMLQSGKCVRICPDERRFSEFVTEMTLGEIEPKACVRF